MLDGHLLDNFLMSLCVCVCMCAQGPRTKFLDTLSLHTCVAGQTTHQRGRWLSELKAAHENKASMEQWLKEQQAAARESNGGWKERGRGGRGGGQWLGVSSPSGLAEVHWLYVARKRGEKMMSKEKRNVFVKGNVNEIRKNFQVSSAVSRHCYYCSAVSPEPDEILCS